MRLADLNLRVCIKSSVAQELAGVNGVDEVLTTKHVYATVKDEAPGGDACVVELDGKTAVVDYQDLII